MPDLALTRLDDLTVLDARGADVIRFLNGQLSQDLSLLPQRGTLLAGLHTPQGRVLALLRLFHVAADHVLVVLPVDLAEPVRAQLAKFVLRSKVQIEPAGDAWQVWGLAGADAAAAASHALHMPMDPGSGRQMLVLPRNVDPPAGIQADRHRWRLDDIAAGIPEVVGATSGLFVAQMLNLDTLDAISFTKGCYTGQEVIARAHYRGQVKRRLQPFAIRSDTALLPGARVALEDGRSALVVSAALADDGLQHLLAVTTPTET